MSKKKQINLAELRLTVAAFQVNLRDGLQPGNHRMIQHERMLLKLVPHGTSQIPSFSLK